MCSYLRSALAAHAAGAPAVDLGDTTAAQPNLEPLGIDLGLDADESEEGSEAGAGSIRKGSSSAVAPNVVDSILSEAYVLNLGTLLAQLEEPDFEQLAYRIQASSALPQKEIEWVGVMMRALA
jgi:hypothetical protein